jgi:excisionase family DNA binding protein
MELLVSTREGARRIGVGKTKFFELLKDERIKAVRIGRRTLIPTVELDRFVAGLPPRRTASAAPARSVDRPDAAEAAAQNVVSA